jgi:hypothetical protein
MACDFLNGDATSDMPNPHLQDEGASAADWRAKHDDLEEELQQASMVIVELEDELEAKNRILADHERHIGRMVAELPPTPAGMKRDASQFQEADAGDFAAPGLPVGIGGLLASAAHDDGATALQQDNERLKGEIRALLEEGHAQAHLVADSDAGSVSSDGSFGTAAGARLPEFAPVATLLPRLSHRMPQSPRAASTRRSQTISDRERDCARRSADARCRRSGAHARST